MHVGDEQASKSLRAQFDWWIFEFLKTKQNSSLSPVIHLKGRSEWYFSVIAHWKLHKSIIWKISSYALLLEAHAWLSACTWLSAGGRTPTAPKDDPEQGN